MDARDRARGTFLSSLPLVKAVIRSLCRRRWLAEPEAEDFASAVMLKLIENDYEVLRNFAHGSSLGTYLTTVVRRAFVDYFRHTRERWRPSRKAKRLGPVAVRLEELRGRHGFSFDEAFEILVADESPGLDRDELAALDVEVGARAPYRVEGAEALTSLPAEEANPEELLLECEREKAAARAGRLLAEARKELPLEDRLILRMYDRGNKLNGIARQLGLKPARVYRKLPRIHRRLRRRLETAGIEAKDLF